MYYIDIYIYISDLVLYFSNLIIYLYVVYCFTIYVTVFTVVKFKKFKSKVSFFFVKILVTYNLLMYIWWLFCIVLNKLIYVYPYVCMLVALPWIIANSYLNRTVKLNAPYIIQLGSDNYNILYCRYLLSNLKVILRYRDWSKILCKHKNFSLYLKKMLSPF